MKKDAIVFVLPDTLMNLSSAFLEIGDVIMDAATDIVNALLVTYYYIGIET
jgi:hypothetical protein